MLVLTSTPNPFSRHDTSSAASIGSSERRHSPRTPLLILSAVVTDTSMTEGSRLKCISGTSEAASAESITRFCSSVR